MIDWTEFDRYPPDLCSCRCGVSYRSHTKLQTIDGKLTIFARVECPGCGRCHGHLHSVRGEPETMTIRGKP